MLDIETVGTAPGSGICTIGAVKFNRDKELPALDDCDTFYARISLESLDTYGFTRDLETLEWWNKQDDEVRREALGASDDRIDIKKVLLDFAEWYGDCKTVWGNGDDFDCVLVAAAYQKTGIGDPPWRFWETRDLRTLLDVSGGPKFVQISNHHHALYDAYGQVAALKEYISRVSEIKNEKAKFVVQH